MDANLKTEFPIIMMWGSKIHIFDLFDGDLYDEVDNVETKDICQEHYAFEVDMFLWRLINTKATNWSIAKYITREIFQSSHADFHILTEEQYEKAMGISWADRRKSYLDTANGKENNDD